MDKIFTYTVKELEEENQVSLAEMKNKRFSINTNLKTKDYSKIRQAEFKRIITKYENQRSKTVRLLKERRKAIRESNKGSVDDFATFKAKTNFAISKGFKSISDMLSKKGIHLFQFNKLFNSEVV